MLITDIDFEKVESVREQLPLLKQRRTDIYTLSENCLLYTSNIGRKTAYMDDCERSSYYAHTADA